MREMKKPHVCTTGPKGCLGFQEAFGRRFLLLQARQAHQGHHEALEASLRPAHDATSPLSAMPQGRLHTGESRRRTPEVHVLRLRQYVDVRQERRSLHPPGPTMSGAGIAKKPPQTWCWVCSRRLHGRFHRIAKGPDGHLHVVHADCAQREGLEVVPGADRVDGKPAREHQPAPEPDDPQ